MNIDWQSKYVRMTLLGLIFFVMLFVIISILDTTLDMGLSNAGKFIFCALVSALGTGWIFRNVMS
jgi:hypothetical protein